MEGNQLEFYTGTKAEIEGIASSILGAMYFATDGGIYSGTGGVAFNHSVVGETGGTSVHNSLSSIQGGSTSERYHLTLAEYQSVQDLETGFGKLSEENTWAEDQYFEKDIHIQGAINSYSQDELNIGDAWINLGTAEAVGIDGGMRIFGSSGATELSRFYYDVSADQWSTASGGYFGGNVGIGTDAPTAKLTLSGGANLQETAPIIDMIDTQANTSARNWSMGAISYQYGAFAISN